MLPMIIINYRKKPPIFQTQLDDFFGTRTVERYESWIPRDYRTMRKKFKRWLPVKAYRRKASSKNVESPRTIRTLDSFLPVPQPLTLPRPQYLLRFRSIRRCVKEDHAGGNIPDYDWIMARSLPTFTGFFNHLIELNDFTVQNDIHGELKNGGASFKKISLMNVFRSELLRLLLGLQCWYRAGGPTLHPAPIKWQGALQVPRAPRQRQK